MDKIYTIDSKFLRNFSIKDINLTFNAFRTSVEGSEPVEVNYHHLINDIEVDKETFHVILGMFLLLKVKDRE